MSFNIWIFVLSFTLLTAGSSNLHASDEFVRGFQNIQNILSQKSYNKCASKMENGVYYIKRKAWESTACEGLKAPIITAFDQVMIPLVKQAEKDTGIPSIIFAMMTTKESGFGANYASQGGNNPFSLQLSPEEKRKRNGKTKVADEIGYFETMWGLDDGKDVTFLKFRNLKDSFIAFAWNFTREDADYADSIPNQAACIKDRLKNRDSAHKTRKTPLCLEKDIIQALVDGGYAGKEATVADYEARLKTTRKRVGHLLK